MEKSIKLSILGLLTCVSLFAQVSYSGNLFHKHFQTCHHIGTTEKDIIIVLNPDSTIRITSYTSSYRAQYNSIFREEYIGTYSRVGDTIRVNFTGHSSTKRNKNKRDHTSYAAKRMDTLVYRDDGFEYPPKIYILSADEIVPVAGLFPALTSSTLPVIMQLETEFLSWDKGSSYKKKIFGVPVVRSVPIR